ncbi:MAG: rod-binding protein [Acidobacteriaceae bacterium]
MRIVAGPANQADIQEKRVESAARQFEGMLINQMLAPMAKAPEGEGNTDGSASQVRETAVQALSSAVSQAGGIGMARMLVRQLQGKHQSVAKETPH